MKLMDRSRDQFVASSSEKDDATTKLRQGSILPRSVRDRLSLPAFKDNPDPVFVVISHSCDLVQPYATEPHVELIRGQSKDELDGSLANGKNPRTLHLEYEQNGTKNVLELSAINKDSIDKRILFGVDPDQDAVLTQKSVKILQRWLAARYNRAAFPDDLNSRMKPIKKKLRSVDSEAIFGIWMKYEPEDNCLSDETPYELWVKLVYSTHIFDGREKAEQEAIKLRLSFEKKFFDQGLWHSIDLRVCEAVADTVFSIRDMYDYKQWRLEHLSLKQDPPGEYIS
jgi:hypothetical protein